MSQIALSTLSIAELIQRARAGEPGALDELFRRSQPKLAEWARQRASSGTSGRLRASDISQEGALRAFERFSTFQGSTEGEWFSWLRTIVFSQANQLLRDSLGEKSSPANAVPLEADEALHVPVSQRSPSQFASQREQWSQVLAHIFQLPDGQREALHLHYREELRVAEVARRMGKSEDAVASLLQRGLAALRDRMSGKVDSEGEGTPCAANAYLDFLRRREARETVEIEAFVRGYPNCADELRGLLSWVRQLEALRPSEPRPEAKPAPGLQIGEYKLGRRIVSGATGEIYEGHHRLTGEPVAVKLLRPELCLHAEVVARFLNEAQTLQRLQHPHLVRALGSGVLSEGSPFLILEWLPVDLEQVLKEAGGSLPAEDCARILLQLASVLDLLHAHGLVHRDLKPANVLVARREPGALTVKLADLGLAKHNVGGVSQPGALPVSTAGTAVLGTWEYMPPEQWLHSKGVGPPADIYSLGVLGFQLLAGRLPFTAEGGKELRLLHIEDPPPWELLGGRGGGPLREILDRMLRKKAAERPTARELVQNLSDSQTG